MKRIHKKAPLNVAQRISRQIHARNTFCWDNALNALGWLTTHQPQSKKVFYVEGFLLWHGVALAHGWLELHTDHHIQILDVTPSCMNDPAGHYVVGVRYGVRTARSLSRSDLPYAESIRANAWHPAYVRAHKRANKLARTIIETLRRNDSASR